MIHIGTSGYSYDDWVGPFYPKGLAKTRFLEHYARHFACVEVNYTYYRMPTAATLGAMGRKVGPEFRFVVKAPGELTHERAERPEAFVEFQAAVQPLIQEGKFGCVLAQFPYSFRPVDENREYLRQFAERMGGLPTVIEFRHSGWVSPVTFGQLRELSLGFCCVDEPRLSNLMPPIAEATSGVGYVRFHGRNAAKWFQHKEAWERYDYLYAREEMQEWVPKARQLATRTEDTYVFFNNHYNAQAVQNASLFVEMLAETEGA
jgi:uncharacterized protein YecE (DUF72 family)